MKASTKPIAVGVATVLALSAAYWLGNNKITPSPTMASAPPTGTRPGSPGATADPYVAGPVKNTLRKQAASMQQLWLAHLATPKAKDAGVVEIDWRIDNKGNPTQVGVVSSTLDDKVLEEGMVRIIAGMNFPAPDVQEKYVVHKFNFKKEDAAK